MWVSEVVEDLLLDRRLPGGRSPASVGAEPPGEGRPQAQLGGDRRMPLGAGIDSEDRLGPLHRAGDRARRRHSGHCTRRTTLDAVTQLRRARASAALCAVPRPG